MAALSSSSRSVSNDIDVDPSVLIDFFDSLFFEPIVSWEHGMVEILRAEGNREELEWLVCLFTICEPYPVEGVVPMDCAYPFRQRDYECYVSFLIDPDSEIYEYDGEYYLGSDACYGFRDEDFVCLDDEYRGIQIGLPLVDCRMCYSRQQQQLIHSHHQASK